MPMPIQPQPSPLLVPKGGASEMFCVPRSFPPTGLTLISDSFLEALALESCQTLFFCHNKAFDS